MLNGGGSVEFSLGEIGKVELESSVRWARVNLQHKGGKATISGLNPKHVVALVDALEHARTDWWRRSLASRAELLKSVNSRLEELADPSDFVTQSNFDTLTRDAETAMVGLHTLVPDQLSDVPAINWLKTTLEFLHDPEKARVGANEMYVRNELARSSEFLDNFEARPLTDEQREAIVIDDNRNLVVAAAGSGKTSVIVAKAGWLVSRGYRKPSELLLLAFARDARKEMEDRLEDRLGASVSQGITVKTFHSLGMAIIGNAEGKRPLLAASTENDRALLDQLDGVLGDLMSDDSLSKEVLNWFQDWFAPYRAEHDFKNWGEYWDYIRRNEIRSLKDDVVKSYEECEIANFLYLNGVEYEYEVPYEHDTATPDKGQYRPDFRLTESGIYIEHFGLNAAGKTAPFVDQDEYLRDMEWKRKLHAERGTLLIETFSHEHAHGKLIAKLRDKLTAHGVPLSPLSQERVFAVLQDQGRASQFARLLATFLQHFKGARMTLGELSRKAAALQDDGRAEAFVSVFRSVYERYEESLSRSGSIDFNDMINRATDHVEQGRYSSPFSYILVDEFQDISPARARLLNALLKQTPSAKLFAVGDDWQAIFRFGGSDISLMREFEEHFGACSRTHLETTFRCSDRVAKVATDFVLRNPSQIRKTVRSVRRRDKPSVHVCLPSEKHLTMLRESLDRIAKDATRYEGTSDVLVLGRYRHLRPQNMGGLARRYSRLGISYMTVHRSKGLEADYVVVLGLCSGKFSFPAEIADDPLLDLVLAAPEGYRNAEERRLLYVALTRARRQAFLLADNGPPSSFAEELIEGGYDITVIGRTLDEDVACPNCGEGKLSRRKNKRDGSTFFGCSNWPYCEFRCQSCRSCGTGLLVKANGTFLCRNCGERNECCPDCDGWLDTRIGKFGRFLGCSNYPDCRYTRNLNRDRSVRKGRPSAARKVQWPRR